MGSYTFRQTSIAKGLAAMLMLFHHLFYYFAPEYDGLYFYKITYEGQPLITYLAILAKVCVAIFLLLSGYGLYESFTRKFNNQYKFSNAIHYSLKHLWKLYSLYWLVLLIFIPICSLFFNKSISSVYHSKNDFIFEILGVSKIFHTNTFNTTWWFMSIILVCYILLPFLLMGIKRFPIMITIVAGSLVYMPQSWFNHSEINIWVYPFVLGMFVSRFNVLDKLGDLKNKKYSGIISIIAFIVIIIIAFLRPQTQFYMDPYFGLAIIILCFFTISKIHGLDKILEFTGKHSASFFLVHTFVYDVFLHKYIYSLWYPPLIFMMHFIVSLTLSFLIDSLRKSGVKHAI